MTAYNDMLSAHKPYESYPELIREITRQLGGVAMVAGGVPAMCDGITQGEAGMELSLFSRDVIAMAAAVALSHQTFDGGDFSGDLRQDRAGFADCRPQFRAFTDDFYPIRPDAIRFAQ